MAGNWWETEPGYRNATPPATPATPAPVLAPTDVTPAAAPAPPANWWDTVPKTNVQPPAPGFVPPAPPAPPETWGDTIKDVGQNMATGILKGVGGLGGLPHSVAQLGDLAMDKMVGTSYQPEVPGEQPTYTPGQPGWLTRHTYSPEEINKGVFGGISAINQATGGKPVVPYEPKTEWGRIGQAAFEQAIPSLVGGAATLPARLAAGLTGGGTGEAYRYFFPNDTTGQIIASLGGSVAGGAVGNRIAALGRSGTVGPIGQAYERLNIDPLAGDITQNKFLQQTQATGATLPFGGRVHRQMDATLGQWADRLEETAAPLGRADTPIKAGTALQMESSNWLDKFKAAGKKLWDDVDMHMPGNTTTPVTNYAQTLMAVRNQLPAAPAQAKTLQPAFTRELADGLISDLQRGPLDWQTVRGIRTRIGEMLTDKQLIGDASYTDLKRIYGALSDDLGAAVQAKGSAAVKAYTEASAHTRAGHDFIDNHLSNYYAPRNGIKPGEALNAAFGDDGEALQAIRAQMPQAADKLAAWKLRDMALATPGRQDATFVKASPGTFLTDMAKLTPETRDALFGADQALAQRVDDLKTVSDAMRKTEQDFLNTSRSGGHMATYSLLSGLAAAPAAGVATYAAGGGIPAAIASALGTAATPIVPGLIAGQLTARPGLARAMAHQRPTYSIPANIAGYQAPLGLLNQQPGDRPPISYNFAPPR